MGRGDPIRTCRKRRELCWFSRETDLVLSLPAAVNQRAVVLDGGLASELARRGHDVSSRLWSAGLLADAPHAIGAVHRAVFAAGAEVATTASYQASAEGFAARGLDAALM